MEALQATPNLGQNLSHNRGPSHPVYPGTGGILQTANSV
jgi:hypothetical protein